MVHAVDSIGNRGVPFGCCNPLNTGEQYVSQNSRSSGRIKKIGANPSARRKLGRRLRCDDHPAARGAMVVIGDGYKNVQYEESMVLNQQALNEADQYLDVLAERLKRMSMVKCLFF